MRIPPNHVMADRLAAVLPARGCMSLYAVRQILHREFGADGLRADAAIQIARLRDQIEVGHGGTTLSRKVSHGK